MEFEYAAVRNARRAVLIERSCQLVCEVVGSKRALRNMMGPGLQWGNCMVAELVRATYRKLEAVKTAS